MMRVGIVDNPLSRQNKKGMGTLEGVAREVTGVAYERLDAFSDLRPVLEEFAKQGVELLVVSGGDGTVQACLTILSENEPFEQLPLIAILPHGTTNMTAHDIGLRTKGAGGLRSLLQLREQDELDGHLRERRLLRLENIKDSPPQVGMFFGGATIYRAIQVCRNSIHPLQFESEMANGLTLAIMLFKWFWSGGRDESLFKGDSAAVSIDGGESEESLYLLFLATTLDRLVLGSRPFWNDAGHAIRFTSIAYPPERILWFARRILYGSPRRKLPQDSYKSCSADRVEMRFSGPFTLDGEFFEPDPSRPLVLTADRSARFVRL